MSIFRRKPSAYAAAIRDSMIDRPERWHMVPFVAADTNFTNGTIELRVDYNTIYFWKPRLSVSSTDSRCIREGIEAWIAWNARRTDA